MARCSRICRTTFRGKTGSFASIWHIAVSIVISTPVRPIPALPTTSTTHNAYTTFKKVDALNYH